MAEVMAFVRSVRIHGSGRNYLKWIRGSHNNWADCRTGIGAVSPILQARLILASSCAFFSLSSYFLSRGRSNGGSLSPAAWQYLCHGVRILLASITFYLTTCLCITNFAHPR